MVNTVLYQTFAETISNQRQVPVAMHPLVILLAICLQAKEAELHLVRHAGTSFWVHPRSTGSGTTAKSSLNSTTGAAHSAAVESVQSEAEHNTRSGRAQKRRRASGGPKKGGKHPGAPEGASDGEPEAQEAQQRGFGREGVPQVPEELLSLAPRGSGGAPGLVAVGMGTVLKAALTGSLTGALAPQPNQEPGQEDERGESSCWQRLPAHVQDEQRVHYTCSPEEAEGR